MLTEAVVKQAKLAAKPFRLWDGQGLSLLVTSKGGKWWRLKFRLQGKERAMLMGTYPKVSLDDARRLTVETRLLIAQGIDPVQHRREQRYQAMHGAQPAIFCLALEADGALTLRLHELVMRLSPSQTAAVRALLESTSTQGSNHAAD